MDELERAKKALANAEAAGAPEDEIRDLELYVADLEQGKGKSKDSSVTVEGISPEQYNRMYGAIPGAILGHPAGKIVEDIFEGTQKAAEARRNLVPEIPADTRGVPTSRTDRILYGTLEDGASSLARQEGQHILQQQLAERAKLGQQTVEQLARQGVRGVDPNIIAKQQNLVPTNRGILTTMETAEELEKAPKTLAGRAKQLGAGAQDLWKGIQYAGSKGWGPVIGHTLGGVALGTDIIDIINRAKAEDPVGAIISGIGAVGSGMSFIPGYGLVGMGIGAGAPALNYLRDEIRKGNIGQGAAQSHENMNPMGDTYATGGLVHLAAGGLPDVNVSAQTPPSMTGLPGVGYMQMPQSAMARMQLEKEIADRARLRAAATGMGMAVPGQSGVKLMPGNIEAGLNIPVGSGNVDISGFRSINPVNTPINSGHMYGANVRYTLPFQKGGGVKKFAAGDLVEDTGESEQSLADAASGIYQSFTNPEHWKQVQEGLTRTRKAIPGVAESVVRGGIAAVPGVLGDIEQLGRQATNAFQSNLSRLGGGNYGTVSETPTLPTTRDILNYVPRVTEAPEGAETLEDVGAFIGPAIGTIGKDIAMLTKGLPVGLSTESVGPAVRELTPKQMQQRLLADKNELGAYSALEEAALNLKQNKGTGDQLYRMLEKEPGVKQEELQYRGLDKFLKGNNEPITKEQILAHLKENELPKITEKKLGEKYMEEGEPNYDQAVDDFHNDWRNAEMDHDAANAEYNYRRYDDTDWHEQRKQEYMEENGLDEEAFDADPEHQKAVDDLIEQDAQASVEDYGPYIIGHRSNNYEIRGNNWGDIELHGPDGHIDNYRTIEDAQRAAIDHALENEFLEPEYYEGEGAAQYQRWSGLGNGNYEEQLFHHDIPGNLFRAPHFEGEGENLLMHMRRQDAETPEGKKVLKIEEQQSDWHQKGRDKGYHNPSLDQMVLDLNAEKIRALEDAKPWTDQGKDAPQEIQDRFTAADDKLQALKIKLSSVVPDAPLKKNWNEFLMKKALHDAAVGDYDKLVWTTGQTQADRYKKALQEGISELYYSKLENDPNVYRIDYKKPGDTEASHYNVLRGQDLENHFGEHIANQMRKNMGDDFELYKDNPMMKTKAIRGENISLGEGRGMSGFYDKMQVDFLNKFLKKYGEKVHQDNVLGYEKAEPVNAVNITPEMRKDLTEKGFPFFKKGGLVALKK